MKNGVFWDVQPPAHAGSSLADFSTQKMEAIRSSETWVHTRSTRRHIPEDGILHSHRRENLKFYIFKSIFFWKILYESKENVRFPSLFIFELFPSEASPSLSILACLLLRSTFKSIKLSLLMTGAAPCHDSWAFLLTLKWAPQHHRGHFNSRDYLVFCMRSTYLTSLILV
jgi:hypothetical protein